MRDGGGGFWKVCERGEMLGWVGGGVGGVMEGVVVDGGFGYEWWGVVKVIGEDGMVDVDGVWVDVVEEVEVRVGVEEDWVENVGENGVGGGGNGGVI